MPHKIAVLFARRDSIYKTIAGCDQDWFGHRAEKRTRLYIVGIEPRELAAFPIKLEEPTHVVSPWAGLRSGMPGYRPQLRKAEREHTPPALAHWLVDLARRCGNTAAQRRAA